MITPNGPVPERLIATVGPDSDDGEVMKPASHRVPKPEAETAPYGVVARIGRMLVTFQK
jgi:hypothetical protein